VHEEVDVVLFAVELLQLGLEVGADLAHDLLTAGQHGVGERLPPVFGDKHQVDVEVVDDVTTGAYIGVWIPTW
jgi:4-diphosphocytidyl-2C-methyl-D-erythritol kinase